MVVGFAAETDDIIENAKAKLAGKGCDWIVANDVSNGTRTLGGDDNQVYLVRGGAPESWPLMSKVAVADKLAFEIARDSREARHDRTRRRRRRPADHGRGMELPAYETEGAAGMDLMAAVEDPINLAPGDRALVPTGLAIALPQGFEAQIRPRSGLAAKRGVTVLNSPGTIDADYRGEVKVVLVNLGQESFIVERAARIAQMVIAPVTRAAWRRVDRLDKTARGAGGFGSTGTGRDGRRR